MLTLSACIEMVRDEAQSFSEAWPQTFEDAFETDMMYFTAFLTSGIGNTLLRRSRLNLWLIRRHIISLAVALSAQSDSSTLYGPISETLRYLYNIAFKYRPQYVGLSVENSPALVTGKRFSPFPIRLAFLRAASQAMSLRPIDESHQKLDAPLRRLFAESELMHVDALRRWCNRLKLSWQDADISSTVWSCIQIRNMIYIPKSAWSQNCCKQISDAVSEIADIACIVDSLRLHEIEELEHSCNECVSQLKSSTPDFSAQLDNFWSKKQFEPSNGWSFIHDQPSDRSQFIGTNLVVKEINAHIAVVQELLSNNLFPKADVEFVIGRFLEEKDATQICEAWHFLTAGLRVAQLKGELYEFDNRWQKLIPNFFGPRRSKRLRMWIGPTCLTAKIFLQDGSWDFRDGFALGCSLLSVKTRLLFLWPLAAMASSDGAFSDTESELLRLYRRLSEFLEDLSVYSAARQRKVLAAMRAVSKSGELIPFGKLTRLLYGEGGCLEFVTEDDLGSDFIRELRRKSVDSTTMRDNRDPISIIFERAALIYETRAGLSNVRHFYAEVGLIENAKVNPQSILSQSSAASESRHAPVVSSTLVHETAMKIIGEMKKGEIALDETLGRYLLRRRLRGDLRRGVARLVIIAFAKFLPVESRVMRNLHYIHGNPSNREALTKCEVNADNFYQYLSDQGFKPTFARHPLDLEQCSDFEIDWFKSVKHKQLPELI